MKQRMMSRRKSIAVVAMLAVATYLVGHAEVARKSAELEALRISQAKEKQTVENAMLFTNLTTKYLRSLSEETPGASWLNLIGFTESMMKQRFPIDASQMNGLWDQRIVVAEDLIKKMGAAGKRTGLESLMIETSLVPSATRSHCRKIATTGSKNCNSPSAPCSDRVD